MKTIEDLQFGGKKVLVRCGFNVPIEDGKILDDTRIKAAVPTINNIINQKPELVLLVTHLGRPGGKKVPQLSTEPIARSLERHVGKRVAFIERIEQIEAMIGSETYDKEAVYLLENIRFWKEEEENSDNFSEYIGQIFDVYVNDAFSNSHREHASMVGFPANINEKCAGLLFAKEYAKLTEAKDNPKPPAVAVIGGSKIATKLPVIKNLLNGYSRILVGGMVANEALDQRLELGEKVLLPEDFAPEGKENERLDIGPATVEKYIREIQSAQTIIWNGPMGKFEEQEAQMGTKMITRAISANGAATQIIGGGETLEAVRKFGKFEDFDYVSMSGGAMLEFLSGKELPAIKSLGE